MEMVVRIFHSFEEADEADLCEVMSLTPSQRSIQVASLL
jgi:hypothetical protein